EGGDNLAVGRQALGSQPLDQHAAQAVVLDHAAEQARLLQLDQLDFQHVLTVQGLDLLVGEGPAGRLAHVSGKKLGRDVVPIPQVGDAVRGPGGEGTSTSTSATPGSCRSTSAARVLSSSIGRLTFGT